jgi:hypothetical protein
MSEIEKKARRRIRRFLETGEYQHRVRQLDEKLFEYKVKHHIESLFFKRDVLGRLRKTTK